MERRNDPFRRIVEGDRADTDDTGELEVVTLAGGKRAEERLIMAKGLAFVVKDRPAGADPTRWADHARDLFGFSLGLLLDLASEAVRVRKIDSNLQSADR